MKSGRPVQKRGSLPLQNEVDYEPQGALCATVTITRTWRRRVQMYVRSSTSAAAAQSRTIKSNLLEEGARRAHSRR
jgi:hypothetical protein